MRFTAEQARNNSKKIHAETYLTTIYGIIKKDSEEEDSTRINLERLHKHTFGKLPTLTESIRCRIEWALMEDGYNVYWDVSDKNEWELIINWRKTD